jgi:aminoglycoside/choline kinase family phosphotransferase
VHNPVAAPTTESDQRLLDLHGWLTQTLQMDVRSIAPASSDASFRRYFRVQRAEGDSLIVMDAPPAQEDSRPFVEIAGRLHTIGLNVPTVLAADLERGYLLLSDLGSTRYLDVLDESNVEPLYRDALDALEHLQTHGPRDASLPAYDRALLLAEMQLFPDWLLARHLQLALSAEQRAMLARVFELLADAALEQPRVCVHRDYHSRNLMVMDAGNPGLLDFQDAVVGPLHYDLVSLLRDCYIVWPREQVEAWALAYGRRPGIRALSGTVDDATWLRWFDLMGVQRHLKASGIFARLWHRDGKPGYLGDVPRTLHYLVEVAARYPELASLHALLRETVLPCLERGSHAAVPAGAS